MPTPLNALILTIALGLAPLPGLAAPAPHSGPQAQVGWDRCADVRNPQSLWSCWQGAVGNPDGVKAAGCAQKTVCPPTDPAGKPVLNCYYEKDWKTGYRCILFCNYGDAYPWGSDGGNGCD